MVEEPTDEDEDEDEGVHDDGWGGGFRHGEPQTRDLRQEFDIVEPKNLKWHDKLRPLRHLKTVAAMVRGTQPVAVDISNMKLQPLFDPLGEFDFREPESGGVTGAAASQAAALSAKLWKLYGAPAV